MPKKSRAMATLSPGRRAEINRGQMVLHFDPEDVETPHKGDEVPLLIEEKKGVYALRGYARVVSVKKVIDSGDFEVTVSRQGRLPI